MFQKLSMFQKLFQKLDLIEIVIVKSTLQNLYFACLQMLNFLFSPQLSI